MLTHQSIKFSLKNADLPGFFGLEDNPEVVVIVLALRETGGTGFFIRIRWAALLGPPVFASIGRIEILGSSLTACNTASHKGRQFFLHRVLGLEISPLRVNGAHL